MWDTIIWSKKKLTCIPQDNNLYQVLREHYTVCHILVLLPSPHPRKGWFSIKNQIKDNKGTLFTWANSLGWRDPSHLKRADRLLSSLWINCWQGFSLCHELVGSSATASLSLSHFIHSLLPMFWFLPFGNNGFLNTCTHFFN